ncbi:MAG: lipopolysaccharide heptosyltransferase II [Candidatus Omnitrophica bacterium]|nr:lipopolysaccharide heptosyltransferase II [Candidatus Omnitrophota bacterium]
MKILVVTLSNPGDVILTLPVFQSLALAFPGAELHVVTGEAGRVVFEADPRIRSLRVYQKKSSLSEKWGLLKTIRAERFDLIVDLRKSLIGLLGGARLRNRYPDFSKRTLHRAERHLKVLGGICQIAPGDPGFLKTSGGLPSEASAKEGRLLVVAAVGSKSDIKKWPAEYYAELLDRLAIEDGCRVVLVGDQNDRADAEKVKRLMKTEPLDLCGRTTFEELKNLIAGAALVVTNDSAPLHIADALGVPVLAIFGPTDPRKYGPRRGTSLALRKEIFCAPCEKAQCRYAHECMRELGPLEAHANAARILGGESPAGDLKILVIRLDRIGDVVLSLPAIEAIRNRFPRAWLSVMTRPYTQTLFEGHPLVDEVIPYFYEKKGRHGGMLGAFRFVREIARRRFDIVFILHPGARSHLLPYLAGIPYRVGFGSCLPFLLTHRAPDHRAEGRRHESQYALDVVRAFGVDPDFSPGAGIPVGAYDESGLSFQKPLAAIHPGASCVSKRWPKERFALLAKKLEEELGYQVAVVGGEEETELGRYLQSAADGRLVDLTGRLTLRQLAAFLKHCRILVSSDSGPVHVAAAVGTPVVSIFGRNKAGLSPARWRPLGEGHAVIQEDAGCVVCLAHRCPIDFECLKAVSVENVFARAAEILKS